MDDGLRILFVGDSRWGSHSRTLRDALARKQEVSLAEVVTDSIFPRYLSRPLRLINRLIAPLQREELKSRILDQANSFSPDVILFYKGNEFDAEFIKSLKSRGWPVANLYPDYSPHVYSSRLKEALGFYDLVISTKEFHPPNWKTIYGYDNACCFVPHGYDPSLHLSTTRPKSFEFDIVMVANGRREYYDLIQSLSEHLEPQRLKVAIVGARWSEQRLDLPDQWKVFPGQVAKAYVEWIRKGRIALAPVQEPVYVDGQLQSGDVDTTRTYELAAAYCCFVHRRTDYVKRQYDEEREVPMYDDAEELANKLVDLLARPDHCDALATAAHLRAVPAYSIDSRADIILGHLKSLAR